MRIKKMVAGLAALATMTALATSTLVSAADGFGVSISNATVKAGESFELTLDMANIPETGINGCDFGISYDASLVTVTDVTLGSLAKDVSAVENELDDPFKVNIEDGVINVMYALGTTDASYYLAGSGTFLTIAGTVSEDAAAGAKSEFNVVPVDRATTPGSADTNASVIFGFMAEDGATTIYEPTVTSGYVEVTGSATSGDTEATEDIGEADMYGDVNLDGDINVADVVSLNMYLLNSTASPLSEEAKANADCLRDNALTTADSSLIMNYVAMMITADKLGA